MKTLIEVDLKENEKVENINISSPDRKIHNTSVFRVIPATEGKSKEEIIERLSIENRVYLTANEKSTVYQAMDEYASQSQPEGVDKPKIVCICGSTSFADLHAIKRWELEKTGKYICLMINYLPAKYAEKEFGEGKHDHFGEAIGLKELLDELHFRKIDLCDEVFVINYEGYIGESTRNEINYAKRLGKVVNYLEPINKV